jgi:diguanylate cyclase (GGDEF)-like protein/PAS domain S-box-containing protein
MQNSKSILLVEDSHFIAMVVMEFLKKNGFGVENVAYGEEAINIVCDAPPDLILMDIELAGEMNGIEAARTIIKNKEIPIIFLTANAPEKVIEQIRNVNAYGFIEKGVNNTTLLATIEMALKLHAVKEEIKEKESILNAIINSVRDALVMVDNFGAVTLFNPAAEELFGYTKEEMLGKDIHKMLLKDDADFQAYKESFSSNVIIDDYEKIKELKARHKNGHVIDVEVSISTLKVKENNYFVGLVRDISERVRVREALEKLSVTDYLTNTYNRRYFITKLEEEIERVKRFGREFSLAMLDMDHFKDINDQFGHDIGDTVLKSVVSMIKGRIRNVDCLARWGGEEFMILLADTPVDKARVLIEELRHGISKINIPGAVNFTGSFGLAGYNSGDTAETLLQKADSLMYEAKSAGRNCVKYRY